MAGCECATPSLPRRRPSWRVELPIESSPRLNLRTTRSRPRLRQRNIKRLQRIPAHPDPPRTTQGHQERATAPSMKGPCKGQGPVLEDLRTCALRVRSVPHRGLKTVETMREVAAESRIQDEGVVPSLVPKWFLLSPHSGCQEGTEQVDPGLLNPAHHSIRIWPRSDSARYTEDCGGLSEVVPIRVRGAAIEAWW